MKTSPNMPGRNDPCSCGSGKKFKNCCLGKEPEAPAKRSSRITQAALAAAAVGLLALVVVAVSGGFSDGNEAASPQENGTGATPPAPASGTPAPWHYDAANNRHWDPDHGHWHDGPPPSQTGLLPGIGAGATPPTSPTPSPTPAPWEYDAANNRHWHPDHGHWHDGPPPGDSAEGSAP